MILVHPKKRTSTYQIPISFLSYLPASTNLANASCTVSVYSGEDPNAAEVVSNTTASTTNALVTLAADKGVPGVIYNLRVKGVYSVWSWEQDIKLVVIP